jgi:hypothetical protein
MPQAESLASTVHTSAREPRRRWQAAGQRAVALMARHLVRKQPQCS